MGRLAFPMLSQAAGRGKLFVLVVKDSRPLSHSQTSITAGTVFHRIRSPLWKWFWAIYQLAQDKKGVAALELAKQISVSYTTAWLMLHKLRRAMRRRDERYVLP